MRKLLLLAAMACLALTADAKITTFQVTIGAAATQVSTTFVPCRWLLIQDNAANTIHIGGSLVSSTRGIKLLAGGSFFIPPTDQPSVGANNLATFWLAGTQNDVIDVVCDVIQ